MAARHEDLYGDDSGHESDHESLNDVLSPTNGYFNERHSQPPDVLIPDPSQASSSSNKEREAQEELEANRAEPTQTQAESSGPRHARQPSLQEHTPRSPVRASLASSSPTASEQTPLIPQAPPAYSPPEPGSPYHSQAGSSSRFSRAFYNTIGRPGMLFPSRDPESLGGEEPLLGGEHRRGRWTRGWGEWVHDNQNKILKTILLLLALLAGIGFIVNVAKGHQRPKKVPSKPIPMKPDPGARPLPASCPYDMRYSVQFGFDDPDSFSILRLVSAPPQFPEHEYSRVKTNGELRIRPSAPDAKYDIFVELHGTVSSRAIVNEIVIERHPEALGVYTPAEIDSYNKGATEEPCLFLEMTVWVKPTTSLSFFRISSQLSNVKLYPGLSIFTPEATIVALTAPIQALPPDPGASAESSNVTLSNSRAITIDTDAGAILGTYPIYDSLTIRSQAGAITVSVEPKPADPKHVKPASLVVNSGAGAIRLDTPALRSSRGLSSIPDRDYQNTITSLAGSVQASLLHGSQMKINSQFGYVQADLYPYGSPQRATYLNVEMESAATNAVIHRSVSHPDEPLRRFHSNFKYQTGSLKVTHPATWEGKVRGRLLTGLVTADWPGLEVERWEKEGEWVGGRENDEERREKEWDREWEQEQERWERQKESWQREREQLDQEQEREREQGRREREQARRERERERQQLEREERRKNHNWAQDGDDSGRGGADWTGLHPPSSDPIVLSDLQEPSPSSLEEPADSASSSSSSASSSFSAADTDNLPIIFPENWGWKRFAAYKGRGQGVLTFEGVTGGTFLAGEKATTTLDSVKDTVISEVVEIGRSGWNKAVEKGEPRSVQKAEDEQQQQPTLPELKLSTSLPNPEGKEITRKTLREWTEDAGGDMFPW